MRNGWPWSRGTSSATVRPCGTRSALRGGSICLMGSGVMGPVAADPRASRAHALRPEPSTVADFPFRYASRDVCHRQQRTGRKPLTPPSAAPLWPVQPPLHRDAQPLVPKSQGGAHAAWLHRICPSQIHALFAAFALQMECRRAEALRSRPELALFEDWALRETDDFYERACASVRLRGLWLGAATAARLLKVVWIGPAATGLLSCGCR